MKVLVACEFSGVVRNAFLARGHDAVSCDLLPSEKPGPHYQDDVLAFLGDGWDLMIAHPPCTYLCNSGVRWLKGDFLRQEKMWYARDLFMDLWNSEIEAICIENPIPHKHACLPKYTQIIQPWQFGHGEVKATCLWLKSLPKLKPSCVVEGREARVHRMPPSASRGRERSRTYPGIAAAMADQWGAVIR
jgi:hypothetical protein